MTIYDIFIAKRNVNKCFQFFGTEFLFTLKCYIEILLLKNDYRFTFILKINLKVSRCICHLYLFSLNIMQSENHLNKQRNVRFFSFSETKNLIESANKLIRHIKWPSNNLLLLSYTCKYPI